MRSLRVISEIFPHAGTTGLAAAEVERSRAEFGANRLTPLPQEPVWRKFLGKFDEPIIKILLAASLLKIVVDLFEAWPRAGAFGLAAVAVVLLLSKLMKLGEWLPAMLFGLAAILVGVSVALHHPSFEGLAVMVAVVLATGVGFLSEYRSDKEFEKLNAQKDSVRVKVRRGGAIVSIPLEDVVLGDLVILEAGDEIPADGRLVRGNEFAVDQSLMTGESEPSGKHAQPATDECEGTESHGCLYRGTQAISGAGEMIVTNLGDDTMLGQIARRLGGGDLLAGRASDGIESTSERVQQKLSISKEQTPLQEKLTALAGVISKVGYLAALLIFAALFVRGSIVGDIIVPETREQLIAVIRHLISYFVYMVIVIVVAVPEGLPMSVTVSLALAMRKMTRANALVRQLVATETIGSATVICSDKTGTLTQNKMTVVSVSPTAVSEYLTRNAALNSTAVLEEKNGKTHVVGNSTEGALLDWLQRLNIDAIALRKQHPTISRTAFNSETKTMTTVVNLDGKLFCFVKGAPEVILAQCSHTLDGDDAWPMGEDYRVGIQRLFSSAAEQAMRTLAFAHVELPDSYVKDDFSRGLIYAGFVAIRDPLREDVRESLDECRAAGIEVKMITGDNIDTARAIARDLGMLEADSLAMSSTEFNDLNDDELKAKLPHLRVLARAKPLDKYRLVKLLQEQHHVVAMTGDGTNDAPSLKKADVGLAMGIAGTEVAKEASKIVLLDDSFSTIVKAVHWGRALYENIQRFIVFQLTINVSALAIAFLGPFFGLKPPFTVLQLLWINVIMDTFAAIALCSEPPRPGLMKHPPKQRGESIVTRSMLGVILATAGFYVVVMMVLLKGMASGGWFAGDGARSHEFAELTARQVTIFFTAYVLFQVWNQINCRSLSPSTSGLRGLHKNPLFLMIAAIIVVGQLLIVNFGGTLFAVEPLTALDWAIIAAGTASVLLFAEIARRIRKAS
jgi:Ca2+-transporting ATPase